ncbi:MAG: hypothetical protein EAZ74_05585 [Alphaproteobacteria bacterium]|nr:MAG: hypothetical protein EAY76_06760 [Alphaproteobacteria bacterium]TAF13472.1 MAG: hypothetical protein EAZ74_05585 [Alphaproteobacteria bacterium]TAF40158.1 MAG: hypothetical protein EAZ66_03650 [Alphaproteobacteria bacterium]TAF77453.1 MAG: hypothetical protein EAZ52_00335 [Alphaproteobacteria bacterium]
MIKGCKDTSNNTGFFMSIYEFIGYTGTLILVICYLLIQSGRWDPQELRVPLCNGIGASFILVSLYEQPNMPSIVIELIWMSISVYGILRCIRKKRQ